MRVRKIITSKGRAGQALRFGMVGAFATLLQYGIYVIFVDAVKVPPVVSAIISYAISFVANFFLSSYFTFNSRPNTKKGLAFILSHLVNMGLQIGLVAIFKGLVGATLALLPAMAICVPVNFLLVRFAFTGRLFLSAAERARTMK